MKSVASLGGTGAAEAEGSWPRWTSHREHLDCLAVRTHFIGFGLDQASGLCSVYMLTSLALSVKL